jgi:hypothetical protein
MGWGQRFKERSRIMTNVTFVATINITVKKIVTLPDGRQIAKDAEMREASAEAGTAREAAEAAFADGFERFVAGLPQVVAELPLAVPSGVVREQ